MNVTQFASELKMPATALLEQLNKAGVGKHTASDTVTEQDKAKLLEYLRDAHGKTAPNAKITLTREQSTEINSADASKSGLEIIGQTNPIPQPVAKCHSCGKPWYGKVRYCPFCGKEAGRSSATRENAVAAPVATAKSSSVETPAAPNLHVVANYASTEIRAESPVRVDVMLPEASEPLPKRRKEKKEADDLATEPNLGIKLDPRRSSWFPELISWFPKLIMVSAVVSIGWWYLKSPEPAPTKASSPVISSELKASGVPKASVPAPRTPAPTMQNQKSESGESPSGVTMPSVAIQMPVTSVGEVISPFPLNEARKYLGAMLDGARDGDDAIVVEARRSLRGIALPPRGDRKIARTVNTVALDSLRRGDSIEAVKWLLGAVKADPADSEVVNNLAFALYKSQRLADARSAALAALTLAPERAAAWANLAAILADEGKPDSAVAAFQLSHRFSVNKQKTKEFLQKLAQEEGSAQVREAAGKALSTIFDSAPSSSVAPAVSGILDDGENCMTKKNYDCAITNAKSALRIDPTNKKAKELQRRADAAQRRAINSIVIN